VGRHLAPHAGDEEVKQMLATVSMERAQVGGLIEEGIEDYLGTLAGITGATYPAKFSGGEVKCYSRKNLVESWSKNGDEQNTKRMAFIWYFAGHDIYHSACLGSHEKWLEKEIMAQLNVEYNPQPGAGDRKSCIRALYSSRFNNHRYNLFRNFGASHDTLIQITHPADIDLGLGRTYRRDKTMFFVRRMGEWKMVSQS
jgi:hypothetical protein